MSQNQKSAIQRVAELELRLKRERAKAFTERAKLYERCTRILFRECPDEMRRLIIKHVNDEEWPQLKKLGINEHLPSKRAADIPAQQAEIASVVPTPSPKN